MPIYFLTATDENGKRETHRTEAENSHKVYHEFESNGFTDIVLHDDDVMATVTSMFPDDVLANTQSHFTPAEVVEMRYLSRFDAFLFRVKKTFHQFQWVFLLTSVLLIYRWGEETALNYFDYVLILISILASFWDIYFSLARKYDQMLNASLWGRWQEVLNRVPKLRGKIPEVDLTAREACALSALGRLDEGLALMETLIDLPEVPRWMYLGRLAELYEISKDYQQVIECARLAYEEAPENPIVEIEYASTILKYGTDFELAKQLLDHAEQQHLGDLVGILWFYYKGLFELKMGNHKVAEANFLICQNGLIPLASNQPVIQFIMDFNRSRLAIVAAELGEIEKAEELYQLALPRLKALDEELIMDCYAEAIA